MRSKKFLTKRWITLAVLICGSAAAVMGIHAASRPAPAIPDLPSGKVQLQSAGALAFGPNGMLFVGDNLGGSVVAIDTQDTKKASGPVQINVTGLDQKIAALVGVTPDQVVVNDMKVNPISKNVYLSASRGKGPDAQPLIVRVDASGAITNVSLDNAKHESVSLADAPAATTGRQNPRMLTITQISYVNGNVIVAGLSNEEWSSSLRSIPFPFKGTAEDTTTLQIWHASHGRYETAAPIRTFVPYTISGKQYILAAYTCTPLVKIPLSDLQAGAKVKGVTIADLGSGNQPMDMIPYQKDGHSYILIANTSRGVMKLKADNLESYRQIDSPEVPNPENANISGVPYDTLTNLKNVQSLTQLDDNDALLLIGNITGPGAPASAVPAGQMSLQTIALP
jgi:hypothetical protein